MWRGAQRGYSSDGGGYVSGIEHHVIPGLIVLWGNCSVISVCLVGLE